MPMTGRGKQRTIEHVERDAQAARLRAQRLTYEEIAQRLGYADRGEAHHAVRRALSEAIREPATELLHIELATLDKLAREAWAVLERKHVTISQGRVVKLDGTPVDDDGPTLAAIDRLLKVHEARRKLLGLDAPVKTEVEVTFSGDFDLDQELTAFARGAAAAARSQGGVAEPGTAGAADTAG
jgi:hypothetical protein